MPGIVGIISDRPAAECQVRVNAMLASMQHRGYACGTQSFPELGVYGGWLAHEDSFSATQPFSNQIGDIALLFAGECFIDPDASRTSARNGQRCAGKGDWIVHLYEQRGGRFCESLNGLFSGLLIDNRRRKLFLFNDRYGMERIYCYEKNGEFYFASEAKALLRILPELREFDEEGVAQLLAYGSTLGERTLFREIKILPAGSLWSFQGRNCHRQKYFSPDVWESQSTLSEEAFEPAFEDTFKRVLSRYVQPEGKVGISLTGGLDSRLIIACLPETEATQVCYTFSGRNQNTLDARLAAEVASTRGFDHRILRIEGDFFTNFASHVDRAVYVSDGYLGPLAAHEIYFNRHARSLAPVRVTGVFGDEVLRGRSFKSMPVSSRVIRPDFAKAVSELPDDLRDSRHRLTFAAFNEISERRFAIPAAARSEVTFRTPYLDNDVVALAYRVPYSLQSSIRPVVSAIKHNSPTLGAIPTDMGDISERSRLGSSSRRLSTRAVFKLDYFFNEGLPHWLSPLDPLLRRMNSRLGIVGRYKFLHYRSWFQQELAPYVQEVIGNVRMRGSRFFNSDFIGEMALDHTRGRKNYVREIDAVVRLEAVERLLLKDHPKVTTGLATNRLAAAVGSCCTTKAASSL